MLLWYMRSLRSFSYLSSSAPTYKGLSGHKMLRTSLSSAACIASHTAAPYLILRKQPPASRSTMGGGAVSSFFIFTSPCKYVFGR